MISDLYLSGFTILRPTVTKAGGIATEVLTTVATVAGRMRPLSGNEMLQNEKLNYVTTHRFYCNRITIRPDDIISKDGNNFNVRLIRNVMEMNSHLEIDCKLKEN